MRPGVTLLVLSLALAGSAAIGSEETAPTTRSRPATLADGPAQPTQLGPLQLVPPTDWQSKASGSTTGMRRAHFLLPAPKADEAPAELVVFHFRNSGGSSSRANLERWQAQVTPSPEMPAAQHTRLVEQQVSGYPVVTLELIGHYDPGPRANEPAIPDAMLLAAIIETPEGSFLLRTVGPRATVEHHRAAWLEMLQSMKPAGVVGPDPRDQAPDTPGAAG